MKKALRITALALLVAILCVCFASCAKTISGKYKGEINILVASYEVVYNFSGNNVTVTRQVKSLIGNADPIEIKGTYQITEGETGMQITFTYETEDDVVKGGTFDFEEGDGYIKIGAIKYTKQ